MSNSLWPHRLQHVRLPYPSPTPGACSNSCPSSQWYHPTISSSLIPFSSCLQSFPAPGSFPMSQFFASGGQSIGVSASTSVLPVNIQDWFPLGLTGLISLQYRGGSQEYLLHCLQKVWLNWSWFQFSSVAQSCLTLCDLMDCSTPGLPVHHQLLEFTQTHVLWGRIKP